jgi:hypothetical protein
MVTTFFVVGLLTSLGCGFNVVAASRHSALHELAWVIGGIAGAVMMYGAIYVDRIAP